MPLTAARAKAAVTFGGGYRLVDFVLSSFVNSGIQSVYVLTQFNNGPLLRHLQEVWRLTSVNNGQHGISALPGRLHRGERWYLGTADAVYQNLGLIQQAGPEAVAIFGADHVYRMDVRQMLAHHRTHRAAATVAALPVPVSEGSRFGTIDVDPDWRIVAFHEKVSRPPEIPGRPGWTLASMGNYLFQPEALASALRADACEPNSDHDFGNNLLPRMIDRHSVYAYDFLTNRVPGEPAEDRGYWRDVGTVEAYYEANLEMLPNAPGMSLLNPHWPIHIGHDSEVSLASARNDGKGAWNLNSVISEGCVNKGATVADSILGRNVVIGSGAEVRESIVMDNCRIAAGASIRRAILDENTHVPSSAQIGWDRVDGEILYCVSRSGMKLIEVRRPAANCSYEPRQVRRKPTGARVAVPGPGVAAWMAAESGG